VLLILDFILDPAAVAVKDQTNDNDNQQQECQQLQTLLLGPTVVGVVAIVGLRLAGIWALGLVSSLFVGRFITHCHPPPTSSVASKQHEDHNNDKQHHLPHQHENRKDGGMSIV
jgi:hypothetical protein